MILKTKMDLSERKQTKRSNITKGLRMIANEIESIGSIELAVKATNILERFLWVTFFVIGVSWLGYFMTGVIDDVNPKTSIRMPLEISDLEYPAITLCSDVTTKYTITEVLGNHIDPTVKLPSKLEKMKYNIMKNYLINFPIGARYKWTCGPTPGFEYDPVCKVCTVLQTYSFQNYF